MKTLVFFVGSGVSAIYQGGNFCTLACVVNLLASIHLYKKQRVSLRRCELIGSWYLSSLNCKLEIHKIKLVNQLLTCKWLLTWAILSPLMFIS